MLLNKLHFSLLEEFVPEVGMILLFRQFVGFAEAVHIELSDERRKVPVSEKVR